MGSYVPTMAIREILTVPNPILKQVSEYDIDRYNTVLITVDPTAVPPKATFDFYDRTGALIHAISYDAVP